MQNSFEEPHWLARFKTNFPISSSLNFCVRNVNGAAYCRYYSDGFSPPFPFGRTVSENMHTQLLQTQSTFAVWKLLRLSAWIFFFFFTRDPQTKQTIQCRNAPLLQCWNVTVPLSSLSTGCLSVLLWDSTTPKCVKLKTSSSSFSSSSRTYETELQPPLFLSLSPLFSQSLFLIFFSPFLFLRVCAWNLMQRKNFQRIWTFPLPVKKPLRVQIGEIVYISEIKHLHPIKICGFWRGP